MAIQYLDNKEKAFISKEIAKYNRRIAELRKQKRFAGVILPQQLNIKNEIKSITNYQEKRRLLGRLTRLTSPEGLEITTTKQGFKITRGFKKQIALDVEAANRLAQKRIDKYKNLPVKVGNTVLGTVGVVHPERIAESAKLTAGINDYKTKQWIQQKAASVWSQAKSQYTRARDELLRENFIRALNKNLSDYFDLSSMISVLRRMNIDTFLTMFYTEPDFDITFIYSLEDAWKKMQELTAIIERYYNEVISW